MRINIIRINIALIILMVITLNAENNQRHKNFNKYSRDHQQLKSKFLENKNLHLTIGFLSERNTPQKANSNFVLTEEVRELTPPWGDPSKEKNEFSHDENGNNTQILRLMWDNSAWMIYSRGNIEYDEQNREVELINQDLRDSSWQDWYKQTTTYNSNGEIEEIIDYFKYTDSWETSGRQTYTYDENNNLIEILFEWANGNLWVNGSKIEYTNDENGFLIEEIFKYDDNGSWVNGDMYVYTYDESGNNIEIFNKIWNGSSWDEYYKQILTYDENNKNVSIMGYLLEDENWRNNTRWTSTYDSHGNNTEMLFEQNWDGSGWSIFERITREFVQSITAVEDGLSSLPEDFSLAQNYPNPFNPSTKISYSIPSQTHVSLKVFDVLGREITALVNEEQPIGNYEVEFDATDLTTGIYFYRMQAGQFVESKKMVLVK